MPWLSLSFDLEDLSADAAEQACFEAGAVSVTLTDRRDDAVLEPAPGEIRLWPATRLQALFEDGTDADVVAALLGATFGRPPPGLTTRRIEDRVWEREWLKDFHAMRFGRRLWVCPRHEITTEDGAVVVVLDPGLAFGTGTHATTAMCLQWLDANPPAGLTVIDYGCGSGILAIAALKLGARITHGFDIDPQALIATADNARGNGVEAHLQVHAAAGTLPTGVDVLLANILSGPLAQLAPEFARLVRPGGKVVLSGLMQMQQPELDVAYAPWFDVRRSAVRDGWVALEAQRRA